MSDWGIKCRFVVSAAGLIAIMTGLGLRLAFLHLQSPRSNGRGCFEKEVPAERAWIYDRNGRDNVLAISRPAKHICADPSIIAQKHAEKDVSETLGKLLYMPAEYLEKRLSQPKRRFVFIRKYATSDQASKVKDAHLPGVFCQDAVIRNYPQGDSMCHVLGFVNHEGVGSAGVEQEMDRYLRGAPGLLESRLNALRQELYWRRDRYVPAVNGSSVQLTLDQNIQHMVENALDDVMTEHHANAAWAIVQKVSTGEILAMASRPNYDLNEFTEARKDAFLNRAIGCIYEPGSTFKAAIFSAAIELGVVTPETKIYCENGMWMYKGRPLRDYHAHGELCAADVLKKSSNIGTAKIALKIGDKRLYRFLKEFGIGRPLGVDLPGEEAGILHPVSKWSNISCTRIAIGQGVSVTALQMLGVFSAIANDGILMKPFVVKEVVAPDGRILYEAKPKMISQPISSQTAALMRRLLARVTEDGGTGRRARVEGYNVAGKTGTAQKPVAGGYSDKENMASFVGFLPAEKPEVAIIVVVDNPQPYHTGGRVAGPAFSSIGTQVTRYLSIPVPGSNDRTLVASATGVAP